MNESPEDPEAVFRDLTAASERAPGVTSTRMFGSTALLVDGHIAAFYGRPGRLVVKLSAPRLRELIDSGGAEFMRMGERTMTGWAAVPLDPALDWWALTAEAVEHVRANPPAERRSSRRSR